MNDQYLHRFGLGRVAVTGAGLGLLFGTHAVLLCFLWSSSPLARAWSCYAMAMAAFHFLEFAWAARYEPASVSWDSFLLNHSPQYHAAVAAGILEFALESALLPQLKFSHPAVFALGLLLAVGGQALRTASMWTAGSNFTHLVQESRREGHDLVQRGVYRYIRHPSYCGWFWWSVGTQLLLCNPVCAVAYALAAHAFFRGRIAHEEETLGRFFGPAYEDYRRRTLSGVPFV